MKGKDLRHPCMFLATYLNHGLEMWQFYKILLNFFGNLKIIEISTIFFPKLWNSAK
jgi:hypothetical protein